MEAGPFVAQVTENVSSRKIRLTRDVIYGFTGRAPKNASHIEDLKYVIETFPHPNLENVIRHQDTGGTIPDSCDVWEKFTDWEMLTEEQKQETKTFLLMRFSVDDLQLAYDQYFVQKGKVPSSVEYRIFINNWQGKTTKRRTQSLVEMMRTIEQKDEEIYRERDEKERKVADLDYVTHISNGRLQQLHDYEHEIAELRNKVLRLEDENGQRLKDNDQLKKITEKNCHDVDQLKKNIVEKDRQLFTRNRELVDVKDNYQGVIKRQRLMIKEKKEEVMGLREENGELNGRMGELSHEKEVLNDKMKEVNNQNMEQSATITEQSVTINEQSATINEQSATINDLQSENSGLKSENSGLKSENSELSATVNTLIDKISSNQEALENLRRENDELKKERENIKIIFDREINVRLSCEQIIAEQSQKLEEQRVMMEEQNEKSRGKDETLGQEDLRRQLNRQEEINRDLYEQLADIKQLYSKLMMTIQERCDN